MGCVSSTLLNQDEDFPQIGSTKLSHHIVSLTSTTYGLLSLEPPPPPSPSPSPSPSPMTPPTPLPRFTLSPKSHTSPSPETEVINSWELMAGLDSSTPDYPTKDPSFRFSSSPLSNSKPSTPKFFPSKLKENTNPNTRTRKPFQIQLFPDTTKSGTKIEQFEKIHPCPPNGENKVVLYTTSLRGVRKTFENCNAVRSVIQGLGFAFIERDISMDRGFRDELKLVMGPTLKENKTGLGTAMPTPPCLFIKGRYIGGADQVLKIHEEGGLVELLQGLPRLEAGSVCDGCGDVRFMPCCRCNGSCKLVVVVDDDENECNKNYDDYCRSSVSKQSVVIRCPDCNENGLVLCPICS